MTALARVETQPTLGELAETIERAHTLAEQGRRASFGQMITAGHALLSVRERTTPKGEWIEWLDVNVSCNQATAYRYMRLAENEDWLRSQGIDTQYEAELVLRLEGRGGLRVRDPKRFAVERLRLMGEAQRLAGYGLPQRAVADTLGISQMTVCHWVNPEAYQGHLQARKQASKKRREQKLALERQSRDSMMRALKDERGECYDIARRLAQRLDRAQEQATSPEARKYLADAARKLGAVEDAIVRAGKLS